jgi:cyclopropane fatty-acyl-phospholipid synthase-like methyltransferase
VLRFAEAAGFETRDVESLREHYALTLRRWVRRLEGRHRSRGTKDEKGQAAYLFGVSFSSVKRATLGDGPFQPQLRASTTDVYR